MSSHEHHHTAVTVQILPAALKHQVGIHGSGRLTFKMIFLLLVRRNNHFSQNKTNTHQRDKKRNKESVPNNCHPQSWYSSLFTTEKWKRNIIKGSMSKVSVICRLFLIQASFTFTYILWHCGSVYILLRLEFMLIDFFFQDLKKFPLYTDWMQQWTVKIVTHK